MLQDKTNKILSSKKDRGFLSDKGSSCFEWMVEHEKCTYKNDGEPKTSDWWEVYLTFSDGVRTVHLFDTACEASIKDNLKSAKTVRKSMDDFIQALEEAAKNQ
ncbi:hypothetical protein LCGC14_1664050 [marine sediment metagenome]|uniref:Uncharacterized protein n=1 Tax=marine sediment metagenome TaxID=412755 RepID=A0A0F9KT78_9ZZZZ